jgi:hypothetical protein
MLTCAALDAGLAGAAGISAEALRHTGIAWLVRQGLRFSELAGLVGRPRRGYAEPPTAGRDRVMPALAPPARPRAGRDRPADARPAPGGIEASPDNADHAFFKEETMLQKLSAFPGVPGPVVVIVMDGYGIPKTDVGSAIAAARKPTLDALFAECPHITLRAHGTAVGMPSDDDMGNSEVGHNAIGAGQVYAQGAALVANAIADGAIWAGEAWQQIVAGAKAGGG